MWSGPYRALLKIFYCPTGPSNIYKLVNCFGREVRAMNGDKQSISCAIDYILEAERNGEINEKNVIYIVENINVAGEDYFPCFLS